MRKRSVIDVNQHGWTRDVLDVVDSLHKSKFTLDEVYDSEGKLAKMHPANHHVREKIRQQLQVLRDLGVLKFLGEGEYRLL
jgi:type II restriction enzyme